MKNLICPLMSKVVFARETEAYYGTKELFEVHCVKDSCAFWNNTVNMCCIKTLSAPFFKVPPTVVNKDIRKSE